MTALPWGTWNRLSRDQAAGCPGLPPAPPPPPGPPSEPGERGRHEGTFPSRLELSKSRPHSQAWRQDLPGPSPAGATQTHGGRVCSRCGLGGCQRPQDRPGTAGSVVRGRRPPHSSASGRPCPWGSTAGTSLPFNSRQVHVRSSCCSRDTGQPSFQVRGNGQWAPSPAPSSAPAMGAGAPDAGLPDPGQRAAGPGLHPLPLGQGSPEPEHTCVGGRERRRRREQARVREAGREPGTGGHREDWAVTSRGVGAVELWAGDVAWLPLSRWL